MLNFLYKIYVCLVVVPVVVLFTAIGGLIIILTMRIWPAFACAIPPIWARVIYRSSLCRLSTLGIENINQQDSYVVVANHISHFDIFVLYGWLPLDLKWVAKKELEKIPIFGATLVALGSVFIDRKKRGAAAETLRKFKENMAPGASVMFFPEGTRGDGKTLLPLKKGAFKMAKDLDLPILPITVVGTEEILPGGTLDLRYGSSCFVVHSPIDVSDVRQSTTEELVNRASTAISSALPKPNEE